MKFDGKKEHETRPFAGTRISFIVFTHNAFEELTEDVVSDLKVRATLPPGDLDLKERAVASPQGRLD